MRRKTSESGRHSAASLATLDAFFPSFRAMKKDTVGIIRYGRAATAHIDAIELPGNCS
jgi:hypothetical protein